jgi:hypothetical protein
VSRKAKKSAELLIRQYEADDFQHWKLAIGRVSDAPVAG